MRIARRLWRSGCGYLFGRISIRSRNDIEHDMVIDVDITRRGIPNVISSDGEIVAQLRIDKMRVGIVQRKLCESLGAIHRRLSPADSVDRAVDLMRQKAIRRIPVVEGGKPVGVVSIGDLALERDDRSALADISAARPNT